MLTRDLKPYDDPVDVYVLDPRGRTMRRWPSMQTSHGVINLNFDLPEYPLVGPWTLRVKARTQTNDKIIQVEHYFRPRFEVFVRLPPTLKTSDEVVEGVVVANMTNWRDVFGNLTLKLQYAPTGHHTPHPPYLNLADNFTDVHEEFIMPVCTLVGHANGHTAGHTNGHTAGHTNGHTAGHTNGHTAGHTNGHTAGHTNGHTAGHTNGHTAGHTNGHTNGHTAGHTAGHTKCRTWVALQVAMVTLLVTGHT
ncbi:uncharacterized protein LOC126988673 [Eriocheir sinensis]|uniref:uncharacterized protein LOC126988673 n=1 Tax=Eriocheir sinensis TaxID=95602 RepID=UPI0021C6B648|nr:uncharacterized protein LOC126988673 [Eriocheir sinensis]